MAFERTTRWDKWLSWEFLIYYCIIVFTFHKGFFAAYRFSSENHPNFKLYNYQLSEGWLFGRQVDLSDHQWRIFRNSLPLVTGMFAVYISVGILLRYLGRRKAWSLQRNLDCKMISGLVGLFVFHGFNTPKVLLILVGSFCIGKIFKGRRLNPILTWTYTISMPFALEFLKLDDSWWSHRFRATLRLFPGVMPRWHVTFNMSILRLISFNLDYYYANGDPYFLIQHYEQCEECKGNGICEKRRLQEAPNTDIFNFKSYLAYVLYLPLYVTGPIITFNDFVSQIDRPYEFKPISTILYGLRWLGSLFIIEAILHLFYVVAIKNNHAWDGFRPIDFAILAYLNLKVLWLKLLIIWRFFRLIAMCDGIITTENMTRCMSNTYSGLAFWRSWHRSFNKWIIRYMYIPLGGTKTAFWNIWPIFTFVAIWHDIRLNLLIWSWLICLFILPEIILSWLSRKLDLRTWLHYCRLSAIAAGGNVFLMGIANLVGFVVGIKGLKVLLTAFSEPNGFIFAIVLFATLYAVASIQLQIRDTERSFGINHNY